MAIHVAMNPSSRSYYRQNRPLVIAFFILPKNRSDAKRLFLLYQASEIMAKDFAEDFVDHRRRVLAHDGIAEFPLDGRERRFDVASLVVVLQKLLLVELEVLEGFLECPTYCAGRAGGARP
jgi:hypothetical protein